jgi:glycine/D-amino acid oxidase-like deaminating enzyme
VIVPAENGQIPVCGSTDVVVVGGGIAGCATAYYLARAGARVMLFEQFDLNTQGSGRNAGSLHGQLAMAAFLELGEQWALEFEPAMLFLTDSLQLWATLSDALGADLEVATNGGLLVAETPGQLRDIERKAAIEAGFGLPVQLLTPAELQERAPYLAGHMAGAEFCPVEGKANPLIATTAFARAAIRHGATVRTWTPVLAVEPAGPGFRVRTPAGEISCERVVCAAGDSMTGITGAFGARLPITGEAIQASVTEPVAPLIKHLVYFAGAPLTLKQTRAGTLLIGGGWPARRRADGSWTTDPASLRANLQVARMVVPAVGRAQVVRTWTGVVLGTPDHRPVIGELPGTRGLLIGMVPQMGFTGGPLLGRTLADLALGKPPERDLSPFAPDRF